MRCCSTPISRNSTRHSRLVFATGCRRCPVSDVVLAWAAFRHRAETGSRCPIFCARTIREDPAYSLRTLGGKDSRRFRVRCRNFWGRLRMLQSVSWFGHVAKQTVPNKCSRLIRLESELLMYFSSVIRNSDMMSGQLVIEGFSRQFQSIHGALCVSLVSA